MSLIVDIEKSFPDFNLRVKLKGEEGVLALLGSSGCGKSLTLKCIAGVEKPDRGHIVINGTTVFDSGGSYNKSKSSTNTRPVNISPQRRGVGYLFQNYALFPTMTVQNNITCVIKKPKKERITIANEMISLFRLEDVRKLYPRQISGGQQQRVALARILVCEPKILLLDEPFSALDSHLRWSMEQEIGLILSSFKGTTIFVSHSSDEVYRLCDHIAVLSQGKIDSMGSKAEVFKSPKTTAAARIVGIRNISKAKKLGENLVKALEWGITLKAESPVPDNVSHVAVRSHEIMVVSDGKEVERKGIERKEIDGKGTRQDDDNILSCAVLRAIDEPLKKVGILAPVTGIQFPDSQIQIETTKEDPNLNLDSIKIRIPRDKIICLEG